MVRSVSSAASLRAGELLIWLLFFLLKFLIFLAESFDASGGIDQLLFAGKKRMTV